MQKPIVLLTHPQRDNDPLKSRLEELAFQVIHIPLVSVGYELPELIQQKIAILPPPNWLFFTSRHGFQAFFQAKQSVMLSVLPTCKLAVIGQKTNAALLETVGFSAQFVSQQSSALAAAQSFNTQKGKPNQSIWWPCGSLADQAFGAKLLEKNGFVSPIQVYHTEKTPDSANHKDWQTLLDLSNKLPVWVVFTSSSAVSAFSENPCCNRLVQQCSGLQYFCIGQPTAATLMEKMTQSKINQEKASLKKGNTHALVPKTPSFTALANLIEDTAKRWHNN
ncbi:MAG: uroporphyrinogen-III synthase [Cyanobacteria bacterium P01_H01_bin.74]